MRGLQREVNLLLAIEEKRWNFRRQRNDQGKRRTEPKLLRGASKDRRTMEDGKLAYGRLVESEGRKELWMSFAEDGFPDIMKVGSWSDRSMTFDNVLFRIIVW